MFIFLYHTALTMRLQSSLLWSYIPITMTTWQKYTIKAKNKLAGRLAKSLIQLESEHWCQFISEGILKIFITELFFSFRYDYDLFQLKNSCLCCQEENYEYREIDLDCPDGGTIPYRYRHIITCSCLDICQQSTTSTVS